MLFIVPRLLSINSVPFLFFRLHGVGVGKLEVDTLQEKRLNRSTAISRDLDQQ